MSTRIPLQADVPCGEEIHSPVRGRKPLKLGFAEIGFWGMILISVVGLAYRWLGDQRIAVLRGHIMIGFTALKGLISSMPAADRFILLVASAMFLVGIWLTVSEARKWRKERAVRDYQGVPAARRPKKAA